MNKKLIILLPLLILGIQIIQAQKDTTKKQSIDITSSYKPVLRNAVKINFSATNVEPDTSKSVQVYNIPTQNLFYVYQAIPLKPLALQQDTILELGDRNFVKAGFGNYTTPLVNAGFSFGDGKKYLLNVYGNYLSSKGKISNQNFTTINAMAAGSYFTPKNEVYGSVGFSLQDQFFYGYNHDTLSFNKKDVLQRFQNISLKSGFKNKTTTSTGIQYNPNVAINLLRNLNKANENSIVLEAPIEKSFNEKFALKVAAKADLTTYETTVFANNIRFTNAVYSIAPELIYAKPLFNIHVGLTPTWDNGELILLPNIYGELKIKDQIFMAQAGLVGSIQKNTLQHLSSINPWLQTIATQKNTQQIELFGGVKATIGKHLNVNVKASFINYKNLPLFVNDFVDGKTFTVLNEESINNIRIHADASFVKQDKFTINGGVTLNIFNTLKNNARAWGTIPFEANASLRWWAFKQLLVKTDVQLFAGSPVLLANNVDKNLAGGADLNAGLEFAINKKFSAWLDINNILNNKYQRWNNYEVYGLNVIGGIIVKF
jgi:hypothetical protein